MKNTIAGIGLSLQKEKERAKELFKKMETPSLKYGQGMQILLKELDLNQALAKENEEERMNIQAPKEVCILNPSEFSKEEQDWYWEGLVSPKENKFLALHNAILNDAKIIIIPENISCKQPLFINSHLKKKAKAETVIIIAEKNSSIKIIEQSSSEKEAYYKSQVIQVYAKENAEVEFCSVQNLSTNTYNISIKRGRAERNASIIWKDLALGGKFTQLHTQTALLCPQGRTENYSAYLGNGEQIFDIYAEALHKAAQTESTLYNRGVLCDTARTVTRGRIFIEKENPKCKAKQKSDNLLVGQKARCDAVPILEVENDDVSCTHGATITHLDEEKLFYLTSRGIEKETAEHMSMAGFIEPMVNNFPGEELQEKIREKIWEKITHEKS